MPFEVTSEFLTLLGTPISAIALILSIIFFLSGRKKRSLMYDIISTPLVTDEMTDIPGLEVLFEGQPMKNITSTTVEFLNTGNQLLEPSDFAVRQPLSLSVSGQFLLGQTGVQAQADNPNSIPNIELIDDHTGSLTFDFLEHNKFFEITLLHTGELTVSGELKGGSVSSYRPGPNWSDLLLIIVVSIGVLLFLGQLAWYFFIDHVLYYLVEVCAIMGFTFYDAYLLINYFQKKRSARNRK